MAILGSAGASQGQRRQILEIRSLQVAANAADRRLAERVLAFLRVFDLAVDGLRQPLNQFGGGQRVGIRRNPQLRVVHPFQVHARQELGEDTLLLLQDEIVNAEVLAGRVAGPPVRPVGPTELIVELRRELKRLVVEDVFFEQA